MKVINRDKHPMTTFPSLRFAAKILPQVYHDLKGTAFTPDQCPEAYGVLEDLKDMMSSDVFTRQLMDDRYSNDPYYDMSIERTGLEYKPYYRVHYGSTSCPLGKTREEAKANLLKFKSELMTGLVQSFTAIRSPERDKRISFLTEFFADKQHADLEAKALSYLNSRKDISVPLQTWQEAIPHLQTIMKTLDDYLVQDQIARNFHRSDINRYETYVQQNGDDPLAEIMKQLVQTFSPPKPPKRVMPEA